MTVAVKVPPDPLVTLHPRPTGGMDTGIKSIDDGGQAYWPNHKYTIPKEKAEELVAAGAEPVGSEKEPKEIPHAAGAAEEEAGDKRVENGIVSL